MVKYPNLAKFSIRSKLFQNGISVLYNNPFKDPQIKSSLITGNQGNGIEVHSQFLRLENSEIMSHSRGAGFQYNPMLTKNEADDFISWLDVEKRVIKYLPSDALGSGKQKLDGTHEWYFITKSHAPECGSGKYQTIMVETDYDYVIGVQLLHRGNNETDESLTFYDTFDVRLLC